MDQQEYIDELIAKCLTGEASSSERDQMANWVTISDANKKYYADVESIFNTAGKKTEQDEIEVAEAWKEFSRNLNDQDYKQPILKQLFTSFYSKAAMIIAMIGLGFFIYKYAVKKETEIVLTSVSTLKNILPDSTSVSINKGALAYSSSFNKKNRELKLTGEAYFHVQHNPDLPFVVSAGNVFIKDIGTAFTIKANPEDSVVIVAVEEGEVLFYSADDPGISLIKDETGIYNRTLAKFRKKEDNDPDIQHNMIRTLSFEGTSLKSVVDTLNKVYSTHIVISCAELESLKLSATFTEATVDPIIETIGVTLNLSVSQNSGNFFLNSNSCKE